MDLKKKIDNYLSEEKNLTDIDKMAALFAIIRAALMPHKELTKPVLKNNKLTFDGTYDKTGPVFSFELTVSKKS